jgi:hypothetical protein
MKTLNTSNTCFKYEFTQIEKKEYENKKMSPVEIITGMGEWVKENDGRVEFNYNIL